MKVVYFNGTRPDEETITNPPACFRHTTPSEPQTVLVMLAELQRGKRRDRNPGKCYVFLVLMFADSFYAAPSLNIEYFVDVTKLHTDVFV